MAKLPEHQKKLIVAVTGAQGVGKSTFCRALQTNLSSNLNSDAIYLLEGLGKSINDQGIPYGSQATPESVAAIYAAHIEREMRYSEGIIILDRCCVDALAYVRCLRITDKYSTNLYEQISKLMAIRIDIAIHLEMTGLFQERKATHESENLRNCIAASIPQILVELDIDHITVNAAELSTMDAALEEVVRRGGVMPAI